MTTAVDTSVLLDILVDDPQFAPSHAQKFLVRHRGFYRQYLGNRIRVLPRKVQMILQGEAGASLQSPGEKYALYRSGYSGSGSIARGRRPLAQARKRP